MTTASVYFKQSELALAAYADLEFGNLDPQDLRDIDMTESQALNFAETWSVVAPTYSDPETGLSATIFQNKLTGQITLAIRGTEPSGNDLAADGLLASGLPPDLNPQFTALKTQIDIWLADGTLGSSFTVTGHSLGGYLAAAVKQTYSQATDAYLFNAPGVGGLVGNLADALASALGLSGTPSENIWNVRGTEGFPLIAGLGYQLGTAIGIQTEAAANPLDNHSIVTLTDALAVYAAFGVLDPTLSVADISAILKASTDQNASTLEAALTALGAVFGKSFPQEETTRDALYTNLQTLQDDSLFVQVSGLVRVESMVDLNSDQLTTLAKNDIAYRYALAKLDAFAVTGDAALYAQNNNQGELNLYDPITGTGTITEQYLKDRAAMLERVLHFNEFDELGDTTDIFSVDGYQAHHPEYFSDERIFEDKTSGTRIQQGDLTGKTRYVIFGSDLAEAGDGAIKGGDNSDHLYGNAGDDTLTGKAGNDYLEGGAGLDTYLINPGDGFDTVLDRDGSGVIQLGSIEATGSASLTDLTKWTQLGDDTWADIQNGIAHSKAVVNGETRLLVHKGDSNVLVKGWAANEFAWRLAA